MGVRIMVGGEPHEVPTEAMATPAKMEAWIAEQSWAAQYKAEMDAGLKAATAEQEASARAATPAAKAAAVRAARAIVREG